MLYVAGSSVVAGFERSKVYRDLPIDEPSAVDIGDPITLAVPDPV